MGGASPALRGRGYGRSLLPKLVRQRSCRDGDSWLLNPEAVGGARKLRRDVGIGWRLASRWSAAVVGSVGPAGRTSRYCHETVRAPRELSVLARAPMSSASHCSSDPCAPGLCLGTAAAPRTLIGAAVSPSSARSSDQKVAPLHLLPCAWRGS